MQLEFLYKEISNYKNVISVLKNAKTVLEASNAGFIKAHFDGLMPNEIAGITYDDIKLELPETEEYKYLFNGDPNSFANAVPYIDSI